MKNLTVLIALLATVCFSSCEKNEPQIIEKIVEKEVPAPEIDQRNEIIGEYSVVLHTISDLSINGEFIVTERTYPASDYAIIKSTSDKNQVLIYEKSGSSTYFFCIYRDNILYPTYKFQNIDRKTMVVENLEETKITNKNSFIIKTVLLGYNVQTGNFQTFLGFFEYRFTRK